MRRSAATLSAALHAATLLLLLFLFRAGLVPLPARPDPQRSVVLAPVPPRLVRPAGGGQRDTLPASKGRLPPPARRVFVPPVAHILNEDPVLAIPQAILSDEPVPELATGPIGNPFAVDAILSGGRGGPGGIGEGGCCGVGNQNGSRLGGDSPRSMRPRQLTPAVLLYKIEPEYSEEARKARLQGVVVITAEIDASGKIRNMQIARPLGLGLDDRAIEAAARWRFLPATADGRPIATTVTIEVNFRLL